MLALSFFLAGGVSLAACLYVLRKEQMVAGLVLQFFSLALASVGGFLFEGYSLTGAFVYSAALLLFGYAATLAVVGGIVALTGNVHHFWPVKGQ